jgi:hypothetical protein
MAVALVHYNEIIAFLAMEKKASQESSEKGVIEDLTLGSPLASIQVPVTSKTLFLHIGMHKTASTYIQNRLRRNCGKLASCGILYPSLRSEHLALVRATLRQEFDLWRKWLSQAHNADQNLLISAEAFSLVLSESKGGEALGAWLYKRVQDFGWDLRIIAFIRDQPSYLNSRYTQLVKRLHTQSSFKRYVRRVAKGGTESECDMVKLFGWLLVDQAPLARFIPFGGVIPVAASHPLGSTSSNSNIRQIDPFESFVDCLPFPDNCHLSDVGATAANKQPGDVGVRLARRLGRHLKKHAPDLLEKAGCRNAVRNQIEHLVESNQWHRHRFDALTPVLVREIRATYAQSNDAFARAAWGSESWDLVFPQSLEEPSEQREAPASPDLDHLMRKVLKSLDLPKTRKHPKTSFADDK